MAMADIRRERCVPAKRGMAVRVDGRLGVIISAKGGYIMVRFIGAKFAVPCHPTWEVEYRPKVEG